MSIPTPLASDEKIVAALDGFHAEKGYAPTLDDLARILGYQSRGALHRRMCMLRAQGKVDWIEGNSRTLHTVRVDG